MLLGKVARLILLCLIAVSFFLTPSYLTKSSAQGQADRPAEFDVRGAAGVPKGPALRAPLAGQIKAIDSLKNQIGAAVAVRYNGLTATPRHLFSYSAYLTQPSSASAEQVARGFLYRWRDISTQPEID